MMMKKTKVDVYLSVKETEMLLVVLSLRVVRRSRVLNVMRVVEILLHLGDGVY